jgi:signal transduction histidine kinase
VEVEVARRNGRAILRVEDDGSGFEVDGRPKGDHFGLRVLRDLVREVGGDLEIDSTPGRGTIVCVEVNV